MTADRFQRVEEIFVSLLHFTPDKEFPDRERHLANLCDGDPELISEVRSLLEHHSELTADDDADETDGTFLNPNELRGQRGERARLGAHELMRDWAGVGTRIGDYTIIGPLGSGSMGVVFIAQQRQPARTVALKLIRPELATPAMVVRFQREAELLGRLDHPGIARIFDAGIAEMDLPPTLPRTRTDAMLPAAPGESLVPFIAMQYVRGPNILDYVTQTRADVPARLELIAQVCDAVHYAHQRGIIHRDLKPLNIIVDTTNPAQPHAKVLDFGVACCSEDTAAAIAGRELVGTFPYMSPEQLASPADEIDLRTDVYAIGAILYHLLSGRPPLDTRGRSIAELVNRAREEEPPPLSMLAPDLYGGVHSLVAKAIAKQQHDRHASAAILAGELRSCMIPLAEIRG